MITALIAIPILGGLGLLLLPREERVAVRTVALGTTGLALVAAIGLVVAYDDAAAGSTAAFPLVEEASWIPSLGIAYRVGVDGISLFLIGLTALLAPIVIASTGEEIEDLREYAAAMLVLEGAVIGVFCSLDLFCFFVFWEAMLVPMYFVIGVWGGKDRRYAAVKFFIYTAAGSLCMLVGIVWLALQVPGGPSFALSDLAGLALAPRAEAWVFAAFALAFAIKVPLVPVHTWLPDAHVQAPTGGSVVLAGVLLKLGVYGYIRFGLGLLPWAAIQAAPWLCGLGVVGVIYGALLAWAQEDVKRLVAYSSISHLGLVVLGVFSLTAVGVTGAVFQMVAHGLSTGALFLLVGILYRRRKTSIDGYGGLWRETPTWAGILVFCVLASIGLPGLAGFVGEFLILLGAFEAHPAWAVLGVSGVVLGAVYMLSMVRRVLFGESPETVPAKGGGREPARPVADVTRGEVLYLTPILVLLLLLGVVPGPVVDRVGASVEPIVRRARERHEQVEARIEATEAETRDAPRTASGEGG